MLSLQQTKMANELLKLVNAGKVLSKDIKFCTDLATKALKYQHQSPAQAQWTEKMVIEYGGETASILQPAVKSNKYRQKSPSPTVQWNIGDYTKVFDIFDASLSSKLKSPSIQLKFKNGQSCIVVPYHVDGGKATGLHVVQKNLYGKQYRCIIQKNGDLGNVQSVLFKNTELRESLLSGLMDFGLDPVTVVKESGTLTGKCSFCNKELTDPVSLANGYGPVCAKKFLGLKLPTAPKPKPVPAVVPETVTALTHHDASIIELEKQEMELQDQLEKNAFKFWLPKEGEEVVPVKILEQPTNNSAWKNAALVASATDVHSLFHELFGGDPS